MRSTAPKNAAELEALETREWLESLDYVFESGGPARVGRLLNDLANHARSSGVKQPFTANTPYINTISAAEQPPFPGSREIERRIKSLVRWNALAMVVKANRLEEGIGGHISTYASAATLYEVGFNHFFKGKGDDHDGDIIYFQGHAAPGIYAHAFMEGRLGAHQLETFRRELKPEGGLSSYPHPWLMPDFWEFPTVSMGLGPISAIYQARFMRYLEDRGLKKRSDSKVWAFVGDGETDEPESLGAITLAVARAARQPDLRDQLQPPAPRRSRSVATGRSSRSSRRSSAARAGTSSRCCGAANGTPCSTRITTTSSSSAWARSSTGSIRSTPSRAARTSASISGPPTRGCSRW